MESGRARQCFSTDRGEGGGFFLGLAYRLIFVHTYTGYVCMSCAKVLHKHIYEEGEIF